MKYALSLAEKSAEEGEVPVGAIVVCDGKIVGEGRNRRETVKNAVPIFMAGNRTLCKICLLYSGVP